MSAARGAEDLLEVIRYQRSKTQIAETELEQARLEGRRLQQQVDHQTRQLDETRRMLADERTRSQATVQSQQQHAELLSKVDDHFVSIAALARELGKFGRGLRAGQRVITGSFTRQSVKGASQWEAHFGALGSVAIGFG